MVYVHVPFCRSFCTYCDFYSEIADRCRERETLDRYVGSILAEIEGRKEEIKASKAVNTVYIGGGTPSVLPLCDLERIVDAIAAVQPGPWKEFTIEVNPEDIVEKGPGYVKGLVELGVNRISMGVQSLDDGLLKWMNRRHDSSRAAQAFRIIRSQGIDNISVDVIFGISQLEESTLESTLDGILGWGPDHISAYQLSVEAGSALAAMVDRGQYTEADEEKCRRQYEILCRKLREAGFHHYEISNWAVPGKEAVHNSAYWTRAAYVGLGPGAHSLSLGPEQKRCWNSQELYDWKQSCEILTEEEIREEHIMLGLRTDKGVDGTVIPEKDWFISDSIILDSI